MSLRAQETDAQQQQQAQLEYVLHAVYPPTAIVVCALILMFAIIAAGSNGQARARYLLALARARSTAGHARSCAEAQCACIMP